MFNSDRPPMPIPPPIPTATKSTTPQSTTPQSVVPLIPRPAPFEANARVDKNGIPVQLSHNISAELYSNLGRQAGAAVMACFEQMGGVPAMLQWANNNPTDFYTKLYKNMMATTKAVEINAAGTDDQLALMEAQFTEISNK